MSLRRDFIPAAVLITEALIRRVLLVIPKVRRGRVLERRESDEDSATFIGAGNF